MRTPGWAPRRRSGGSRPGLRLPPRRAAVLAVSVAGFLVLCLLLRRFVTDDAWISVRYAETLATGHGFRWNFTGPRVEGFSNPALVGLEALARWAGASPIATARALGVAAGVALLIGVYRWAPAAVGTTATGVALLLIALAPAAALWAVGGLETSLAALATTAGVLPLAAARPARRAGLRAGAFLAVLPWLRPEGVVVAVAAAAAAEAPGLVRGPARRPAAARLLLAAGLPLASQAVLEALRLGIYGHLLPNSALYKHATALSLTVPAKFVHQAPVLLALAGLGALTARGRARVLAVPPLVYALGSLQTVDSVNALSRFFLPAWPLLALLAGSAVAWATRRLPRARTGAAALACAVLAAAGLLAGPARLPRAASFAEQYASCRQTARAGAATWLLAHTPPSAVVSISDAGLVPARAGARTMRDQFLLNEPLIQRTGPLGKRARARWLHAQRPDVIILAGRNPRRFRPRYGTEAAIVAEPGFRAYALAAVARGHGARCSYHLFLFRRAGAQVAGAGAEAGADAGAAASPAGTKASIAR